jgi:hypothetical protein
LMPYLAIPLRFSGVGLARDLSCSITSFTCIAVVRSETPFY